MSRILLISTFVIASVVSCTTNVSNAQDMGSYVPSIYTPSTGDLNGNGVLDIFDPVIWDQDGDGVPDWDDLEYQIWMQNSTQNTPPNTNALSELEEMFQWEEMMRLLQEEMAEANERIQRELAERAAREIQEALDRLAREAESHIFPDPGNSQPASP